MSPTENQELFDRVVRRGTQLRRRRQMTGAGAGAALVVLALLGVAVAFTGSDHETEVAAGQSTTTTLVATTTTIPSQLPTVVAVPTTTVPGDRPAPSPVTTVPAWATTTIPGVQPGCRNSTEMACGPAYWDPAPGANQPMTVQVTPSTSSPKVGEAVTFAVVVSDPDARVDRECNSLVVYGDGQGPPGCATTASCVARFGPWTPPDRLADRYEVTFTHTYTTAGDVTASFTFKSNSSICGPDDPYGSTATGQVVLHVSA